MGILSAAISSAQQAASTARQMRFQEHSYRHRYQWQMEDMKKAGLNPMLAFEQSPPGALQGAAMGPGQPFEVGDDLTSIFSAKAARKTVQKLGAEIGKLNAEREGQQILNDINRAKVPFKQAEEDIKSGIVNTARDWWNWLWSTDTNKPTAKQKIDNMLDANSAKKAKLVRFDTIKPNPMPKTYREAEYSRKYREHNRKKPTRRGRFTWSESDLRND